MQEHPITHDYCAMRSKGIERVQERAERRMDGHSQKLDDLTRACLQLTATVDRVSLLLEKQDQRLDRVENRGLLPFLESGPGKTLLRFLGIGLLTLLGAAVGVNLFQILSEVL